MDPRIKKTAIEIAAIILVIAALWYAFEISTFSSLSNADAKLWLRVSELTLFGSAILLAVGLIGEWPDSESWKQQIWYKAAKFGVIIGVMGELLGDAGVFEAGDRLQSLDNAKIIAMESYLLPRTLAEGRDKLILEKLTALPPYEVLYAFSADNEEEINLAISLHERVFHKLGWRWVDWPAAPNELVTRIPIARGHTVGKIPLSGIQVRIINWKLVPARDALIAGLKEAGFGGVRFDAHDVPKDGPKYPILMQIMIGQKPRFLPSE